MLSYFAKIKRERERKKIYFDFYLELEKNLERYYVCFQLNDLRPFFLEQWQLIKDYPDFDAPEAVKSCVKALEEYNKVLEDFKQFEGWYSADADHKTRDSASILHEKKEKAKDKFSAGLEDLLKSAIESFEGLMLDLKIVKKR